MRHKIVTGHSSIISMHACTACIYTNYMHVYQYIAVLKVVYHKEKETEEGYYITIESALIPNRYLAINMEQPSQEGSDKYYPLQFTSKEKVNSSYMYA